MKLATILLCTAVTGLVACGDKSSKKKAPEEKIPAEILAIFSEGTDGIAEKDIAVAKVDVGYDSFESRTPLFSPSFTSYKTLTLSKDVSDSVSVPNTTDKLCTAGLPQEAELSILDTVILDIPKSLTFGDSSDTEEDEILFPNNFDLQEENEGLQIWLSERYEEDGLLKIRQFKTNTYTERVSMTTFCWAAPNP